MSDDYESAFVGKEPCPSCGSRDNLGRYSDGHAYCYGCGHYERAEGHSTKPKGQRMAGLIDDVEAQALTKRGITEETCAKFGYGVGTFKGQKVQVARFPDESGRTVAQHVRFANKDFIWLGDIKDALPLWGQQLWRDGGKKVVITEGEIDAMSVSQVQGNRWPVVSIKSGAQGAKRDVKKAIEWLLRYDEVIFMFDMDEPGQDAARECALLLPPGKAKIASLPLKDANDMLRAHRGKELVDAVWAAKTYRPDGLVTVADVAESVMTPPTRGLSWCFESLNDLTYGRRYGEVYAVGAGTGVGKTDFLTQQVAHDTSTLEEKVGVFFLEQQPEETVKRIAGKLARKRFHVPDAGWSTDELRAAVADMATGNKLFLYDHFGCAEWSIIESRIRYLHASEGVRIFYLDHLTALAAAEDDERKALERIMSGMGGIVKELDIMITIVSHLATPDGRPHEEGGRVMIRHFKGSRAIGYWCHYMFGMERDQQAEEEADRQTTTFRVLKDRYTGQATGKTFSLGYDVDAGLLVEKADTEFPGGGASPFPVDDDDEIPF